MRIITILFAIAIAPIAHSADWKSLNGTYAFTSNGYLDPADDEQQDSHYRIQLKGNSAKDLYEAMKVKAVKDECAGDLAKNIGNMQCLYFQRDSSYECHFSINIAKQVIEYGIAC